MALPSHIDRAIRERLAEIHCLFRPGAKLLLLIDNGTAEESVMIGDADSAAAIQRIGELEAIASAPPSSTATAHDAPYGGRS